LHEKDKIKLDIIEEAGPFQKPELLVWEREASEMYLEAVYDNHNKFSIAYAELL
jgi:hypothetical protein